MGRGMMVAAASLALALPAFAQDPPQQTKLTFAFKEASVETLLLYVSQMTGWIFVQEAPLRGTVTAYSRAEVPVSRCLEFLETCLRPHGLAVRNPSWPRAPIAGETIRVVDAAKATPTLPGVHVGLDASEIPVTDAPRTQILPLTSAGAADVVKDLGEMLRKAMGEGGQVAVSTYSNSILLTGRSEGIHRVAEILRVIDQTASAHLRIQVLPIDHGDATEIAKTLNDVLRRDSSRSDAGGGQLNGLLRMLRPAPEAAPRSAAHETIRIAAEPRMNAVIVAATDANLELLTGVIRSLDRPAAARNTYVIPLINQDAAAMAPILDALWNGKGRPATPSAPAAAPASPPSGRRPAVATPRR